MPLLALYGIVVVGAWLASTLRSETTLLRGTTVFGVHASFLAAQAAWLLATVDGADQGAADARTGGPEAGVLSPDALGMLDGFLAGAFTDVGALAALTVFAALAAASFSLRRLWLLSGFEEAGFREVLELSLRQLRIPFEREASAYALTLGTGEARVAYRSFGDRRAVLRFEAPPVHSGAEPARGGEPGRSDAFEAVEPTRISGATKKLDLLRSLLTKRFGRLLPRPKIRFE